MKLRLFVLLSCIYLAAASREPPWGDAHVVYETTEALLSHGRLDIQLGGPPQFFAIRDGKRYGVFPLGHVIAMAPGYMVFSLLALIPGAPVHVLYAYTSHLPNSLLVAGACVLFFVLARREGASERSAFWLSLALGTTTILVVYARNPYSEATQTLILTWLVERALTLGERLRPKSAVLAGLAAGLLINTKLVYAVVLPVILAYVIIRHRRDHHTPWGSLLTALAAAAVPCALLFGFALWHNHLKTGAWLDSGYRIPEGVFSGDAYAALHGYLLSPGKSVFLYSPLLILGVLGFADYHRRRPAHARLVLAVIVTVLLVNAKFRYWHADYCWGPRLLVPLTPVWLLPAAPWLEGALGRGRRRLRRLGLGLLLAAGLFVQLLGSAFYWDHYIRIAIAVKDQTGAAGWYTEDLHHCHFIPQFSPLVGHAWMLRHVLFGGDPLADAPWRRVAPGRVRLDREWSAVRIDWWGAELGPAPQLLLPGVLIAGVVLAGGVWAGLGLRRRLRAASPAPLP
jgi:hypothetical protein